MFDDQPTVIESGQESSPSSLGNNFSPIAKKGIIIFAVIVVLVGAFFLIKQFVLTPSDNQPPVQENETPAQTGDNNPTLPDFTSPDDNNTEKDDSPSFDIAIEYMSFADFYQAPDNTIEANPNNYELPLNVKIDVMNYYDVSRKLNLDPGVEDLNSFGFTVIDNPWEKEVTDFYSVYGNLETKQVPLLITSDFITYYYQNILKKVFKDIEENVFYDNLWDINKELYTIAKDRYEARLSMIGNINDSILEGERLEAAFFAVALELLKPTTNQIAQTGMPNEDMFDVNEVNKYYFVVPPYLREDVVREIKLIKEANKKTKSPVFLYDTDYVKFNVPNEYRSQAKLYNFYLTTKWLNSVFPLNYRDASCPDCLLDREDWRINLIAASLITNDFAVSPELKNKWARIYKVISYFKGLRENLNYVHYRDTLVELFNEDYNLEELFDDSNENGQANLETLRQKLLSYDFAPIQGAWDKNEAEDRKQLGFRVMVDYYWPNNYFFDYLVYPSVGDYQAESIANGNVTTCPIQNVKRRCNGFALDIINLIYPVPASSYFDQNTNYFNYTVQAQQLRGQLEGSGVWHTTNYWTTLNYIKTFLEVDKNNLPIFAQSSTWRDRSLKTAVGAWINLQLPLEKFTVNQFFQGQGLDEFVQWDKHSYVDPNLNLVNELIASNQMLLKMFTALKIDDEINSVAIDLQKANTSLTSLRDIIQKEIKGEELTARDNEVIANFAKQLKVEPEYRDRQLSIKSPKQKNSLKEDLSKLKLLVVIHRVGDNKVFAVGPVWQYSESY